MAIEIGQHVGDYEVLSQLGTGGMGRVFKVRSLISNREEAMKILLPDFASDQDLAARFMAEIRTLAGLDHPGIAQLRTAFQFQNQLVMIMEFVEGITLEKLAAQIRIPVDHVLDYASQALAALSYAHARGVTHRDIKPANIMITTHGLVKLTDFGIAKSKDETQLTRPGTTMGSVYYMSPEQVRGSDVDARSDLYSLGVTLYEVLTGRRPFQGDTSYGVLDAHLNQAPAPLIELNPAVPPALNAIVLRAMEKLPEQRFQTADEFRSALKALREPAPTAVVEAPPLSTTPSPYTQAVSPGPPPFQPVPPVSGPPPHTRSGGHRGLWIGLGAVLALLALAAVGFVAPRYFSTHAQKSTPLAQAQSALAATPAPDSGAQGTNSSAAQPANLPAPAAVVQPAMAQNGNESNKTTPAPAPARKTYLPPAQTQTGTSASQTADASPAAPPVPPGPSQDEVRHAHDRYSKLQARADAAIAGVQQIETQQQAQGLGMRGDIVAANTRLQLDLRDAEQALDRIDLAVAAEYMDRGEREVETLEKFLGR